MAELIRADNNANLGAGLSLALEICECGKSILRATRVDGSRPVILSPSLPVFVVSLQPLGRRTVWRCSRPQRRAELVKMLDVACFAVHSHEPLADDGGDNLSEDFRFPKEMSECRRCEEPVIVAEHVLDMKRVALDTRPRVAWVKLQGGQLIYAWPREVARQRSWPHTACLVLHQAVCKAYQPKPNQQLDLIPGSGPLQSPMSQGA